MTAPDAASIFHSRFNRIMAVVIWALCAGALAAIVVSFSAKHLIYLVPVALLAYLAWTGLWQLSVRVDDTAVTLVNVFSTVTVPWAALIQVDTRFALTLHTPWAKFTASAAPAPSRVGTVIGKMDSAGLDPALTAGGSVRPSDLPASDSGAAAYLVRERWHKLSEAGLIELGVAETTPAVRRWHWASLAICGVLLLASLALLLAA